MTVLAVLGLGACAVHKHADRRTCPPDAGLPMMIATLYFGLPAGGDAEQKWQTFVGVTVVGNLPDGFTVTDAQGAWRDPRTTRTVQEKSKMMVAVVPDTAERRAALDRIRRTYERDFHQQLVGLTTTAGCADFQPRATPRRPD